MDKIENELGNKEFIGEAQPQRRAPPTTGATSPEPERRANGGKP